MRLKAFFIHDEKVFEYPMSKYKDGEFTLCDLANQRVLLITMTYETFERAPNEIIRISYERVEFDGQGLYDVKVAIRSQKNLADFAYVPFTLTDNNKKPLPIPQNPDIPNEAELNRIKMYLDKKYPLLLFNTPHAFEIAIQESMDIYHKKLTMFKDSYKNNR